MSGGESSLRFACFGGSVTVLAGGIDSNGRPAADALAAVRLLLLDIHQQLTRFEPTSELSRFNADPRECVPASPLLRRLARAVGEAGALTVA
jgi:thiamine biosynthesis lipoprotein